MRIKTNGLAEDSTECGNRQDFVTYASSGYFAGGTPSHFIELKDTCKPDAVLNSFASVQTLLIYFLCRWITLGSSG
jgi:hypothetical protein